MRPPDIVLFRLLHSILDGQQGSVGRCEVLNIDNLRYIFEEEFFEGRKGKSSTHTFACLRNHTANNGQHYREKICRGFHVSLCNAVFNRCIAILLRLEHR
jgi:hypothetical protein